MGPRSRELAGLIFQVVFLAVVAGAVYLLVLGSGLQLRQGGAQRRTLGMTASRLPTAIR